MRRLLPLLAVLLLAACGDGVALDRLAGAGKGRVVEVRSADVVVLDDGEPVKLAGLAAMRGEPYAQEARKALDDLVLGQEVELLSGGAARDPFDRRVAHLRLVKSRRWVQGEMLQQGAGRVRTFSDNRALARQMLEREARARTAGRGLWAFPHYQVRLPWEVRGAQGFQVVEGKVSAVRRFGEGYELDLQGHLAVEIPARAAPDFVSAGKPAPELAGRLVRVRGTVRGGSMRADHPEAVEVLEPEKQNARR